uniref:Uncharacterized protein n=1 Tax=Varanus komodoensis TaxID=61221 RepID=A0A8D2J8C4_VARKO
MRSFSKREADRRTFLEQVRESKENGYLLSSKKIGSGAFSKVYLGYATQEKMMQNYKLASDLRSKRHSMVSTGRAEAAPARGEYPGTSVVNRRHVSELCRKSGSRMAVSKSSSFLWHFTPILGLGERTRVGFG